MKEKTYGASGQFVILAIMVLVVGGLAIPVHGHDIRKHGSGSIVLIRIEEDAETLEFVLRAEDGALVGALLGEPHGEAVAVEGVLAMDLEFEFDLGGI